MIEKGVPVALSTDYNPGSSPTESLPLVMTLGCLHLGLTPEEVLTAMTVNAAWAIEKGEEVGTLEVGKRADLVMYQKEAKTLAYLPYHFGINHVDTVIKNGQIVVKHGTLLYGQ